MKVFTLVATVATFTADLSYARPIGKIEASAIINLPLQRHFRPVAGSTLSTSNAQKNILSQIIHTRHDSNSRRAVLEDQSEDSSEKDASDQPKNFSDTRPMETSEETSEDSTPEQDQHDSDEDGRRTTTNEDEYTIKLPPFRSGDGTEPEPLDFGATPISALNPLNLGTVSTKNLNINLVPPINFSFEESGIHPFVATPVPKDSTFGTKVSSLPKDESVNGNDASDQNEVNSVSRKTVEKSSNTNGEVLEPKKKAPSATKVEATQPETPTGGQKEENADNSDAKKKSITGSNDTDRSSDKAVEKVKADGTPVVVNIYLIQTTGEKGEKRYEITKAFDDESADTEAPIALSQENKAELVAKAKSELPGDEKSKISDDVQPVKKQKSTSNKPSTEPDKEESNQTPEKESTELPGHEKPTSDKPSTKPDKEKSDNTAEHESNQTPEKESTELPGHEKSTSDKPSTKPDKEKSDNTAENESNQTPEKESTNQETVQKKADKEDPSSEKMKHVDDNAFDLTEAEKDASPTAIEAFGKTSLPADVVDLIAWKGDPGKEPQDVSKPISPASEQKRPQRRWTRSFRA